MENTFQLVQKGSHSAVASPFWRWGLEGKRHVGRLGERGHLKGHKQLSWAPKFLKVPLVSRKLKAILSGVTSHC